MKQIITLMIMLLCTMYAVAQVDVVEVEESGDIQQKDFSKYILKWSPIDLVDFPSPMFRFALEHRLDQTHALEYSLGVGYGSYGEFTPDQSYKARLSYRHYFKRKGYFTVQTTYKHTIREDRVTVCRSGCAFFENLEDAYRSNMLGLTVGLGRHRMIGEKWSIDYGFALGTSRHWTKFAGLDDSSDVQENNIFILPTHPSSQVGDSIWPYILLQCKFGYVF